MAKVTVVSLCEITYMLIVLTILTGGSCPFLEADPSSKSQLGTAWAHRWAQHACEPAVTSTHPWLGYAPTSAFVSCSQVIKMQSYRRQWLFNNQLIFSVFCCSALSWCLRGVLLSLQSIYAFGLEIGKSMWHGFKSWVLSDAVLFLWLLKMIPAQSC